MWTPKQERHWELARGTHTRAPSDPLGQQSLGPAIQVLTNLPATSDAGLHLRTTGPKGNRFGQKLNPLSDLGSEFLRGRVPADPLAGSLFILRAAGRRRQEADLAPRMASLGPALQRFPPPSFRPLSRRGWKWRLGYTLCTLDRPQQLGQNSNEQAACVSSKPLSSCSCQSHCWPPSSISSRVWGGGPPRRTTPDQPT